MLQPHLHAVCVEVFFQVADGQQLLVEDARRKACVDALVVEQLQKVFLFACAAAGNDGHIHPRRNCIQHFQVEAIAHAVGVDAVQADLARAVVHAPADPVQCIPAGILAPALGEHPELAVHPLHIGREHHALVAVALCCRRDKVRVFECARVDADLVRAALEHVRSEWVTLTINRGKRDKLSKKDVVGFLFQKGGLEKDDLGIVEIKESCAFAAVKRTKLSGLLGRIRNEKIKNMKAKFI